MLDDRLKQTAVLGAAGKMGSGIALLLLREMVRLEANRTGDVGKAGYLLHLIDVNPQALDGLKAILRTQMMRYAEKNADTLQTYFSKTKKFSDSADLSQAVVDAAMQYIRPGTNPAAAASSSLIFEAVIEDVDIKSKLFSEIDKKASAKPFYFTNTSSIPIGVLAEKSGLGERLIGFHFYNPPAVQRLLEIIPSAKTSHPLTACAQELAKRLGKIVVFSNDVAGFIGNGHFIREIDAACRNVKQLRRTHSLPEALWMMNRMTQEFLIRPMGIFQLLDYVGLDVGKKVMAIMQNYLSLGFDSGLIDSFVNKGIMGGQYADGTQKDGIFRYEANALVQIHDGNKYVDFPDDSLGPLPEGHQPWKILQKEQNQNEVLKRYFANLFAMDTPGAKMAQEHLLLSRDIARGLVADGVAWSIRDVNTVLMNGFYHLYGPDNPWIPENKRHG